MWLIKLLLWWWVRRRTRSLAVGGRKRTYHVHVPPQYRMEKPAPVVLALHGATMTGPLMAWFSGLNQKADQAGFLAVYPNGTGPRLSYTWNGGNCCGSAVRDDVDDVAFIRAVLDDLATAYHIDPQRVFAAGMSNGAVLAYRLASELSDRIAAVAPVAGPMGTATCGPKRPVPVLHFHGTDDEFVPFSGGVGRRSVFKTDFYSVVRTIRAWVKADGCKEEPLVRGIARQGERRHESHKEDLRRRQGRCRGRPGRHRGRRAHLAGPGAGAKGAGQGEAERVGQRPDVGVLREAPDEVSDTNKGRVRETNVTPAAIRKPGEGRTIAVVGDVYRFLATGDDTNGKYAL